MGIFCLSVRLAQPHKMYKQVLLIFALAMATACATKYGYGYNDHSYNLGYNDHDSFSNYDQYNYNSYGHHGGNSRLHKRTVFLPPFLGTKALLKLNKLPIGRFLLLMLY